MRKRVKRLTDTGPRPANASAVDEQELTTFSIRLNARQTKLLKEAADIRGWSPTALIRTATIEKAAYIRNTARPTAFNYKGLAIRIAESLFQRRNLEYSVEQDKSGELIWEPYDPDPDSGVPCAIRVKQDRLPDEVLDELIQATKEGGTEFLNQIVEFSQILTERQGELPEPIDPSKLIAD